MQYSQLLDLPLPADSSQLLGTTFVTELKRKAHLEMATRGFWQEADNPLYEAAQFPMPTNDSYEGAALVMLQEIAHLQELSERPDAESRDVAQLTQSIISNALIAAGFGSQDEIRDRVQAELREERSERATYPGTKQFKEFLHQAIDETFGNGMKPSRRVLLDLAYDKHHRAQQKDHTISPPPDSGYVERHLLKGIVEELGYQFDQRKRPNISHQ